MAIRQFLAKPTADKSSGAENDYLHVDSILSRRLGVMLSAPIDFVENVECRKRRCRFADGLFLTCCRSEEIAQDSVGEEFNIDRGGLNRGLAISAPPCRYCIPLRQS